MRETDAPRRLDLGCADVLQSLHERAFACGDKGEAVASLYGLGFSEGCIDALAVMDSFHGGGPPPSRFPGGEVPLLFTLETAEFRGGFAGSLQRSIEAEAHLARFGRSDGPCCFISAAYSSGWFSELLSEPLLVREVTCRGSGADLCRFEARRLADWRAADDEFVADLLLRIDPGVLRTRAHTLARDRAASDPETPRVHFDPMTPAAHIWGPVLILPWSGAQDSEDALESIERDIGVDPVRVAVVDLTGARIDALEASGLARVLDRIEGMGIEAILVGLTVHDMLPFTEPRGALSLPLRARDLSEGIALGFQMCLAPPTAT